MDNQLITTEEAAKIIGICRSTIIYWTRSGKLKLAFSTPPGGHRKFLLNDIIQFKKKNRKLRGHHLMKTGEKRGRLTLIKRSFSKNGRCYGEFNCDCGRKIITEISNVNKSRQISCGCIKKESWFHRRIADGEASFNALFSRYKKGAEYRNLSFEIKKEEFRKIVTQKCHYCNRSPSNFSTKSGSSGNLLTPFCCNGIDRIENNKGYTKENCVPCCARCNKMKHKLAQHDFVHHCKLVCNFQKNKSTHNTYKKIYLKNTIIRRPKSTLPHGQAGFNNWLHVYKKAATQGKRIFNISKKEFKHIVTKPCAYCGQMPVEYRVKRNDGNLSTPFFCNGIDRINNHIGYIKENCTPCCKVCNLMKHVLNYKEFINQCETISKKETQC